MEDFEKEYLEILFSKTVKLKHIHFKGAELDLKEQEDVNTYIIPETGEVVKEKFNITIKESEKPNGRSKKGNSGRLF